MSTKLIIKNADFSENRIPMTIRIDISDTEIHIGGGNWGYIPSNVNQSSLPQPIADLKGSSVGSYKVFIVPITKADLSEYRYILEQYSCFGSIVAIGICDKQNDAYRLYKVLATVGNSNHIISEKIFDMDLYNSVFTSQEYQPSTFYIYIGFNPGINNQYSFNKTILREELED